MRLLSGHSFRFANRACRFLAMVLCATGLSAQICVVLSPATITGGTAVMELSLYSTPPERPAALGWTLRYPAAGISSLTVDDGPALTSAGKTTFCARDGATYRCLAVAANNKSIANGVIAKVTAVLTPGGRTAEISITDAQAAAPDGKIIAIPLRITPGDGVTASPDCRVHSPQAPQGRSLGNQ